MKRLCAAFANSATPRVSWHGSIQRGWHFSSVCCLAAGADPVCQHGHWSAGPPVHPHVYGPLQEIQNPQQDHTTHCQALQNLQSGGELTTFSM